MKHLLNIKTVAERRERICCGSRTPEKVYFKKGSMPVALDELGTVVHKKKAFIVTDSFLYKNGYVAPIERNWTRWESSIHASLRLLQTRHFKCARKGVDQMRQFEPDTIIALGGGSAMDASKIMWIMYEHQKQTLKIWLWTSWTSVREYLHSLRWERKLTS